MKHAGWRSLGCLLIHVAGWTLIGALLGLSKVSYRMTTLMGVVLLLAAAAALGLGLKCIRQGMPGRWVDMIWPVFLAIGLWIVAALIFLPLLAGAHVAAVRGGCMSNAKSLTRAAQMYLEANNDAYPPSATWFDRVSRYREVPGGPPQCLEATSPFSYAYNAALGGLDGSAVQRPELTVAFFEANAQAVNTAGGRSEMVTRHGGTTIGMTDGHVKVDHKWNRLKLRWNP